MGRMAGKSTRFFGQPSTFSETFPSVERAIVRFTETDAGWEVNSDVWMLQHGPIMPCRNPRCERGGYNFDWQVVSMVDKRIGTETVSIRCGGDEGSPKGRKIGRECDRAIKGTIEITYKSL